MTEEKKEAKPTKGVSRREFLAGTVGGVIAGAAVTAAASSLGLPRTVQAQNLAQPSDWGGGSAVPTSWDLVADVVVIGSGGAGMPAALAAQAAGASVIVVEMNYDVGGHAIVSGGTTDLGGGTSAQAMFNVVDSADLVFQDLISPVATNWGNAITLPNIGLVALAGWGGATLPATGASGTKYQDRALSRVFADKQLATFNFLVANGITWTDNVPGSTTAPTTSHWYTPSKIPRTNTPTWKAQTPAGPASPNAAGGAGYIRPLEITARNNGVQFLLNYRMTTIYREQPYAGRVLGVSASYTGGRIMPGSTTPLQPYCTTSGSLVPNKGNITMTQTTVNIKANMGVIVATGGQSSNVMRRKRFDMRMCDVYHPGGDPYSFQTGDGEYAAQRIGAALYAPGNEVGEGGQEIRTTGNMGGEYIYAIWQLTSPIFPLVRATGLTISNYQDIIYVNMAGTRFHAEGDVGYSFIDDAMAANANSIGPDYSSGPIWAIFDSAAVTREKWTVAPPSIDPLYFFQGKDIPTLVQGINTSPYQVSPMDPTVLQATITKYNGFVTAGKDTDFGKPTPTYPINAPPYYAANATPMLHDWLTGLQINGNAQVLDLDGNIIPGLYAAGESASGFDMHGLAKCATFGMIAGNTAATEESSS